VPKESPWQYGEYISGSGARRTRQSFLPQRRWGMLQRHARRPQGVPRGNALGDSFPDFSSRRNRAQRSVFATLANLRLVQKRGTAAELEAVPFAHFTRSFFTRSSWGVTYTVL